MALKNDSFTFPAVHLLLGVLFLSSTVHVFFLLSSFLPGFFPPPSPLLILFVLSSLLHAFFYKLFTLDNYRWYFGHCLQESVRLCARVCVCDPECLWPSVSTHCRSGVYEVQHVGGGARHAALLAGQFFFFLGELDCSRVSSCMKMSAALKSVWEAFVVIDQPCSMCLSGALQV